MNELLIVCSIELKKQSFFTDRTNKKNDLFLLIERIKKNDLFTD